MVKSVALESFLNGEYNDYDGYRALELPYWDSSMCAPLCFEPSLAKDQFENGVDPDDDIDSIIPLALFYKKNSVDQISDIWAFIVAKVLDDGTEEILLWTDEDYTSLKKNLNQFLKDLISPTDRRWAMGN